MQDQKLEVLAVVSYHDDGGDDDNKKWIAL
jgi:hypothetical protein